MRDLGLEIDDFAGKDSVEVFALISEQLTGIEDQAKKSRVAVGLFGRAGANLLPTMKALADEGLGAVIERAEELGVLIDYDLAAAAEKIKDDVEILKMQSEALGVRFISGFGPAMSQALQTLSGDIKQTTGVWEDFGKGVGAVLKWIIGIVSIAFDFIGSNLGAIAVTVGSYGKRLVSILKGDFEAVRAETKEFNDWWDEENKKLRDRIAGRWELLTTTPPPAGKPGEEGAGAETAIGDPAEMAALAARRAAALQSALDQELAMTRKFAALRTAAEKRELEEGLQDVSTYYADRRAIAEMNHAEELRVLREKERLLEDISDPARRLQEEEKIKLQLRRAELEHENAMAALSFEERKAVRDLANELIQFEQTLLEMQGKRIEAERLGFEEQIAQADLMLRKQGASDAEREASIARLRAALESGADFEEAKRNAEAALTDLAQTRQEIDAQAAAGLISQFEAETQILAVETERIETLRTLAAALEAAALATGDPDNIAAAREFAAGIREIEYAVQATTDAFAIFRETALGAGTAALTEFLDRGLEGSKNLKDAFRDMVTSIVASLRRMAAELLAVYIMQKLTGLFGLGGGGEVTAAGGGLVRGAGTGTSDSIRARLSDQEFITRAAVVRQPGVLEHLRALNREGARALAPRAHVLEIPATRFAAGGLVEAGGSAGETLNGQLSIGLEDGLVLREMETPEGQRVLVKSVSANRRAIRAALGL